MIQNILVIGGTGLLGFPVAKQLKEDGYKVSILTTNPENALKKFGEEYTYIQGNVKDTSSLSEIFKEHHGLHINLNSSSYKELQEIEVEGCINIASAASKSEIRKITMISGLGVKPANAGIPFVKAKIDAENTIKRAGIPYTIFNCTHFIESIPLYIRNGKAMIMGAQSHKIHWLSAEDYARMVSKAYEIRESDNKNYSLIGPETYTMKEVFEKYIDKVDPGVKITKVSLGILRFIAGVTFNKKLGYVVDLMRYFDKTPEQYDVEKIPLILGKAETKVDDWLDMQRKS
jgi:uncharacterized protein YbjT (DUF2867 family)